MYPADEGGEVGAVFFGNAGEFHSEAMAGGGVLDDGFGANLAFLNEKVQFDL